MIHLLRLLLLCVLALPLSGLAEMAEADLWRMMEKAGQAAHKLNYKGIFVYQSGRTVSSTQIIHMNYPQGEFARLMSLDGVPREVLRQGNEVVVFNPRSEKVTIEKWRIQSAFPGILPSLPLMLKAGYRVSHAGEERSGGRLGVIVQLEPRDGFRYGYRFTFDSEFGLLLKSVMLDERKNVIEQVAFNQLTLMSSEGLDWFTPAVEPGKTYVMEPEETITPSTDEESGWVVTQLPPGFKKVHDVRRTAPGKSVPINHLVFSDGLASVSLFVEAYDKRRAAKLGQAQHGATNINAMVLDGYQIVVVGEVPAITVKQIAEAVSFRK